ncbi:unnamed protein product [Prorocentrum cordatum]|uniref:Uncharacterized protein n=1 Tax=Prorocentrum cordatum TaxID=2364126 RepID=A0ABN9U1J6_9DINO|nr:unnamed protein product [Polarella glacialis]
MASTPQAFWGKPVDPAYPLRLQCIDPAELLTCRADVDEIRKALKTWEHFFDQETVSSLTGPFMQFFGRTAEQHAQQQAAVTLTTEGDLHKRIFQVLNQGSPTNDDKVSQGS